LHKAATAYHGINETCGKGGYANNKKFQSGVCLPAKKRPCLFIRVKAMGQYQLIGSCYYGLFWLPAQATAQANTRL
jgi:hypothetical protein